MTIEGDIAVNTLCFTSHKNLIEPDISATIQLPSSVYKTEQFTGELKYCYMGKRAGISKKIQMREWKRGGNKGGRFHSRIQV